MRSFGAFLLMLLLVLWQATAYAAKAEPWIQWVEQGKYEQALKHLKENSAQNEVSAYKFYRAILAYKTQEWQQVIDETTAMIQQNQSMVDYAYLFRGKAYLQKRQVQLAMSDFVAAESAAQLDSLKEVIRFYKAETHLALQNWQEALDIYEEVKKPLRGTEHSPHIVWGELVALVHQTDEEKICRAAKELHLKYPNYAKTSSWGAFLNRHKVYGKKLPCKSRFHEQRLRIKRLLWAGREAQAKQEIEDIKKSKQVSKYKSDRLQVTYYLYVGYVEEALALVKSHNKRKGRDYEHLMLLGRVQSKNQKLKEAVASYDKAFRYAKTPGQKEQALFDAGYLSYYHKNYRGAIRRFSKYMNEYPKGRHFPNAFWYKSWCNYLAKRYSKAAADFIAMIKIKEDADSRERRRYRRHSLSKLKYWLAMTWYRQDLKSKARSLFTALTHDDSIGYYSVAAIQRLTQLQEKRSFFIGSGVHENWWLPQAVVAGKPVKVAVEEDEVDRPLFPEQDPFYKEVDQLLALNQGETLAVKANTSEASARDISSVYVHSLEKAVDRARILAKVGELGFAQEEILSVERRDLSSEQKQLLMSALVSARSFYRLARMSSYQFSDDRRKLGIHHGNQFWKYSYPQAYLPEVRRYSQNVKNVPEEFVWSIMRAETIFRPNAISPVGARGLMQVMPNTGRKIASLMGESFAVHDLTTPKTSIQLGSYYLSRLMKKFKNRIPLVAASYNGGPHRVHAWLHYFGDKDMDEFIEHIPFKETRNYVKKVTKYYAIYNLLYKQKTDVVSFLSEPIGFQPEGSIPTRETWERIN